LTLNWRFALAGLVGAEYRVIGRQPAVPQAEQPALNAPASPPRVLPRQLRAALARR